MKNRNEKVRLKDIAGDTGFSVTTVAKVLSGSAKASRISEDTSEKILAAADRLGYIPNMMARKLRSNRSGLIGIHLATADDSIIVSTMTAILQSLPSLGYAPILTVEETSFDRCIETWIKNNIEGIIFCGPTRNLTENLAEMLKTRKIPAVIAGNPFKSPDMKHTENNIPTVQIDNTKGIQLAVEHLAGRKRRRIAFISGPDWHTDADERRSSYENAIAAYHEPLIARVDSSELHWHRGYLSAKYIIDHFKGVDAVIAYDDNVALGAMKFLSDNGVTVPAEIAVVGFDNQPQAEYAIPSLTTIDQPADEIGRKSLELLQAIISGSQEYEDRIFIEPTLRIREST